MGGVRLVFALAGYGVNKKNRLCPEMGGGRIAYALKGYRGGNKKPAFDLK